MDIIRLGLVGSGGMAHSRARSFADMDGCRLTALAARNPHTGADLAERHSLPLSGHWEDLIGRSDVDAIVICTNNDSHGPIARAALEAGIPVFLEYPIARHVDEGEGLVGLARETGTVLRVAHPEVVSGAHRQLKETVGSLGDLLAAAFTRLTPGRGARPEVLFNLPGFRAAESLLRLSGLPARRPVRPRVVGGRVCPVTREWTGTEPTGASSTGSSAGFAGGGTAEWTWAGGISIGKAEQFQRIVMENGTMIHEGGGWRLSAADGKEEQLSSPEPETSLESLFLEEVRGSRNGWRGDLDTALDAVRIGLGAEEAANRGGRVHLVDGGTGAGER